MSESAERPVWLRDLAVGIVVTAVALTELWLTRDRLEGELWAHAAMNLLILPALALRRVSPLSSAVLAALSLALQPYVGESPVATGFLVLLAILASLGWYADTRTGLIGLGAVVAGGLVFDLTTDDFLLADMVVNVVLLVATWAAGRAVRGASDRRVAAELETDRAARLAVQEERSRISRDLHDSVAHTLTLITLQAGTARERATDEETASLLGSIEQGARDGLGEMHRFLRLLDHTPQEQPGIRHVPDLVQRVRHGGDVDVAYDVDVAATECAPDASTAVYRVVQEALTNAVRHSHTTRAQVSVRREGDCLVTLVTSTGRTRETPMTGSGRGLVGLRERVEDLGGTVVSEPTADGWQVEARIPVGGAR